MTMKKHSGKGNKLTVEMSKTHESFVNAIRRMIIEEVPTLAIEDVEIKENSSALYDEMLALRLGLLPIKTDLKTYELKNKCACAGEGCARCELVLLLKSTKKGILPASDMQSKDPKCTPVHGDMPVVFLLPKQKVELQATAILGTGKQHAKWSPGLAWHQNKSTITVNQNSKKLEEFKSKYPAQIFDKSGKIKKDFIVEENLVDAVDGICDDIIKVEYDPNTFLLNIESWGQLSTSEIMKQAADMLIGKCEQMEAML